MDTSVTVIGLVLLAIITIPIYYVIRSRRMNYAQIQALFAQYNQDNRYEFQLLASHNSKALGFDTQRRGLLFIDFNLNEPYVVFKDLAQSQKCDIVTLNPQGKPNTVKKVEWIFTSKNGNTQDDTLLFHDEEKPYIVPVYAHEELQLAKQWQQKIQQYL